MINLKKKAWRPEHRKREHPAHPWECFRRSSANGKDPRLGIKATYMWHNTSQFINLIWKWLLTGLVDVDYWFPVIVKYQVNYRLGSSDESTNNNILKAFLRMRRWCDNVTIFERWQCNRSLRWRRRYGNIEGPADILYRSQTIFTSLLATWWYIVYIVYILRVLYILYRSETIFTSLLATSTIINVIPELDNIVIFGFKCQGLATALKICIAPSFEDGMLLRS